MSRIYGWLDLWNNENRFAIANLIQEWGLPMTDELVSVLEANSESTAEDFIEAFFHATLGPENLWPREATQWLEAELEKQ